jgi:hypothetical protein
MLLYSGVDVFAYFELKYYKTNIKIRSKSM